MIYNRAGLDNYSNLMGINYVRPPLLNFKIIKETGNYTEYEIKTYKKSKEEAEKKSEIDGVFTNDIDS